MHVASRIGPERRGTTTPLLDSDGQEPVPASREALMAARRVEQEARVSAYDDLAECYEAIQTSMAWDTIYDPSKERVVTPVCHLVSVISGGYILFCWDIYFGMTRAGDCLM